MLLNLFSLFFFIFIYKFSSYFLFWPFWLEGLVIKFLPGFIFSHFRRNGKTKLKELVEKFMQRLKKVHSSCAELIFSYLLSFGIIMFLISLNHRNQLPCCLWYV